jgi:hypothetical protein
MREFKTIYDIVEREILRCPTQYYVKDKETYQPIIIAFDKGLGVPEGESSLYISISVTGRVKPFYDKRYDGSIKIEVDSEKYEIGGDRYLLHEVPKIPCHI